MGQQQTGLYEGFNLRGTRTYEIKKRHDGRYNVYRLYINVGPSGSAGVSSPQRHRVWQTVMVLSIPTRKEMKAIWDYDK